MNVLSLCSLLFFLVLPLPLVATVRNFTIDDQKGDELTGAIPVYAPPQAWANQACEGCAVHPDITQLFEQTSTSATFMPDMGVSSNTIDFIFNGTAIYIFFTLFNFEGEGTTVNTECNFTIDGQHVGYFNHAGDSRLVGIRQYQVPVFSKTGLQQRPHHMVISMSEVNYHVFLSFDYAIYTQGDPDNNHKAPAGAIVGGVLGGLCVLLLLGFSALLWLRRRSQRNETVERSVTTAYIPRPVPIITHNPMIDTDPELPRPGPVKPRLIPRSPPRSIHGGSTVVSDLTYTRVILPSPISSDGNVAQSSNYNTRRGGAASTSSFTRGSESSTTPSRLAEEVRRIREELTSLHQGMATGQLTIMRNSNLPLPLYSRDGRTESSW